MDLDYPLYILHSVPFTLALAFTIFYTLKLFCRYFFFSEAELVSFVFAFLFVTDKEGLKFSYITVFSETFFYMLYSVFIGQNINYFYSFAIFTPGLLTNEFLNYQYIAIWALFLYLNFDWIALFGGDKPWTFWKLFYYKIHVQFLVTVCECLKRMLILWYWMQCSTDHSRCQNHSILLFYIICNILSSFSIDFSNILLKYNN